MDPPSVPIQVADPEQLVEQMTTAGLDDVRVATLTWDMEFQSATHLWDVVTNSNRIGTDLVRDLTSDQVADVKQILDSKLCERSRESGPAVLTTRMNIGIGTK